MNKTSDGVVGSPPHDIIKVNVDASISSEGWIGFAAMAWNCNAVLFAALHRVQARPDPGDWGG